jgi:YaiO family outer membrane protein
MRPLHRAAACLRVAAFLASVACAGLAPAAASGPAAGPQDDLARARELATSGHRSAALALLQDRLAAHPDDPDARTLLGIVLSWEGRYGEARTELRRVLADRPGYYDAVAALVHVELWDDHPAIALDLAEGVLRAHPDDTSLLLARARALGALHRTSQAIDAIDGLLALDPSNTQARQMRERLVDSQRSWAIGAGYGYDGFSDGRTSWQEQWLMLRRRTGLGTLIFTGSRADRYGETDGQYEVEAYPRIRPGTYLYLDAAWSPDHVWYPSYRAGAHVYQSLGHGFEGSIGLSRLGFGDGLNIYIGSLSKYVGNWLLIGQVFIRPKDIGTNASYHAAFRYYYGDRQYFGLRYHYGSAKERIETVEQIQILNSKGVSADWVFELGRRLDFRVRAMYDDQERLDRSNLKQYTATAQVYVKF